MAFAFVQQAENSAAASGTSLAAPAVTYTSGNLLVVWTYWDGGDGGTFGVADGGSNTYTLIANKVSGGRWAVYYVENCTGGSLQPTMSWSAAVTNRAIYVAEYSGIATSGALISGAYDVDIAVTASGTDILISDNINVTTQPALMVGVARSESQEVRRRCDRNGLHLSRDWVGLWLDRWRSFARQAHHGHGQRDDGVDRRLRKPVQSRRGRHVRRSNRWGRPRRLPDSRQITTRRAVARRRVDEVADGISSVLRARR